VFFPAQGLPMSDPHAFKLSKQMNKQMLDRQKPLLFLGQGGYASAHPTLEGQRYASQTMSDDDAG